MTQIVWAPQALDDLEAIRRYVAQSSTQFADLVVWRLVEAVDRLERYPRSGRTVPEVGNPSLREIVVGNYRIVYRLRRDVAEILMVFHGARAFPRE